MRVVTFNIHHGTVGSTGPVDPDRLGRVCAEFEADVLALQEVDLKTRRARGADLAGSVARSTGMEHRYAPSLKLEGGWYGNALFVRGEIGHHDVAYLPRSGRQEQRTVLVASVRVDGVALTVAACHLAVEPELGHVHLDALADLVEVVDRPLVVLGDTNREPAEVEPYARRLGLTMAAHGPTQPATRPRLAIDHVMVTADLVITDVEVRPTEMSDHCALVVDLRGPRTRS